MMTWIKKHPWEFLTLLLLFLLTAFLRLYRIDQYLTFLGDEGRDMLVVKRIFDTIRSGVFDLPLLGPPMSVGNLYLGPLYYYLMAGASLFFWLSPVAPAVLVALFGIAAVFLIYYLAKTWFGFWPALVASALYSLSPVTINYSRSSWNPNPLPFFVLLIFSGFNFIEKMRVGWWLILVGASFATALQLHYTALILLPIIGLLWIYLLITKQKRGINHFWWGSLAGLLAFLLVMLPLVLFDVKNGYPNWRSFTEFFTKKDSAVSFSLIQTLEHFRLIYFETLVGRLLTAGNMVFAYLLGVAILIPLLFISKKKKVSWPLLLLGSWMVLGLIGITFYKGQVHDHYLFFLNSAPYLLLAAVVGLLKGKFQLIVTVILILGLGFLSLPKNPLLTPPNQQLQKTERIADFIIQQSKGQPFNFALIAERNYDAAYQFILGTKGATPKQLPFEKTSQLFVVCEDPVCAPINNSKFEIAAFGWASQTSEDSLDGVRIFRLIPNPDQKDHH